MKMWGLTLFALLAAACNGSETSGPTRAAAQAAGPAIAPWDAGTCGDDDYQNEKMERHPALVGRTANDLLAAFGKPSTNETFRIGEPAGTFYGPFAKRLSGPPHPDLGDPARVLTWTKNGCNFSVFFVEPDQGGRVVEAFEWAVGADF